MRRGDNPQIHPAGSIGSQWADLSGIEEPKEPGGPEASGHGRERFGQSRYLGIGS